MTTCSIGRVTMSDIDCGGSVPGVRDDDDARELQRRIDAARQGTSREDPADDEGGGQQRDGARVPQRQRGDVHFAPSFSPAASGSASFAAVAR